MVDPIGGIVAGSGTAIPVGGSTARASGFDVGVGCGTDIPGARAFVPPSLLPAAPVGESLRSITRPPHPVLARTTSAADEPALVQLLMTRPLPTRDAGRKRLFPGRVRAAPPLPDLRARTQACQYGSAQKRTAAPREMPGVQVSTISVSSSFATNIGK